MHFNQSCSSYLSHSVATCNGKKFISAFDKTLLPVEMQSNGFISVTENLLQPCIGMLNFVVSVPAQIIHHVNEGHTR